MMILASSCLTDLSKVGREKFEVSICCSIAFVVIEPSASVACTMQGEYALLRLRQFADT